MTQGNRNQWLPWITTPLLALALLLTWQIYVQFSGISGFILPTPLQVWDLYLEELGGATLWRHTRATLYETIFGFAWATAFGLSLGVMIGRWRWLETTLNPFIVATQVIPKVALVPLFVVWFGFGSVSKVAARSNAGLLPHSL